MSGSFGPSGVATSGGATNLASPVSIGNINPNTVASTDLTNSARRISIPGSTQVLIATSSIACTANVIPISAATPITLTGNPQIATGSNGQKVTLVNVGSNAITLVVGNGLLMPSNIVLYGGRAVSFTYMTVYTSWIADVLIPESVALTGIPTAPTAAFNANSTQLATTAQTFNHLYNHDSPGWRNLTLTANWVNFGGSFPTPAVKRIGRDMIFIQGVVNVSGSYGATIATLPADCRPPSTISLPGFTSVGAGQIQIASTGVITSFVPLAVGQFQVIQCSFSL